MDVDTDFSTGQLLGVGAGLVAVVGAFLPWVVTEVSAGPVDAGGSAAGIEGLGAITLALGLVAVGAVVALDWSDRGALATALVGVAVVLVSGWKVVDLGGPASPGLGIYLTLLAGLVILASGLLGLRSATTESVVGA